MNLAALMPRSTVPNGSPLSPHVNDLLSRIFDCRSMAVCFISAFSAGEPQRHRGQMLNREFTGLLSSTLKQEKKKKKAGARELLNKRESKVAAAVPRLTRQIQRRRV